MTKVCRGLWRCFLWFLTLHTFLCCSPSLKHLILTQTLTVLEEKLVPITQSRAWTAGAPADTQNDPVTASNFGHTSHG